MTNEDKKTTARVLYELGLNISQIAQIFRTYRDTVCYWRELDEAGGIQWCRGDDDDGNDSDYKRRARELWITGKHGPRSIASTLLVDMSTLCAWAKEDSETDPWMTKDGRLFPHWGYRKWDHPDLQGIVQRVLDMDRSNCTISQIMAELEISSETIRQIRVGIAFSSGLPYNGLCGDNPPDRSSIRDNRRKFGDEERMLARQMYWENSSSVEEIARTVGASRSLIYRWIAIDKASGCTWDDQSEGSENLITVSAAANRARVTPTTISNMLSKGVLTRKERNGKSTVVADERWDSYLRGRKESKCLNCGRSLFDLAGRRKYCSEKCSKQAYSRRYYWKDGSHEQPFRKQVRICENCGEEYYPRVRNQRFCTRVCARTPKFRDEIRICDNCGKEYRPRVRRQRFCSISCGSKWWSRKSYQARRKERQG